MNAYLLFVCVISILFSSKEWEEKLCDSHQQAEKYKKKYLKLKDCSKGQDYMDEARSMSTYWSEARQDDEMRSGIHKSPIGGPGSVISIGSSVALKARQIAGELNCGVMSERTDSQVKDELREKNVHGKYRLPRRSKTMSSRSESRSTRSTSSRSVNTNGAQFQEQRRGYI